MSDSITLSTIPDLLAELRAGRPVILVDDENRENEGDLLMPAATATPQWVNFMAREGRGLICVTLTPERARRLDLTPMVGAGAYGQGTDPNGTAFTVKSPKRVGSIEALIAYRMEHDPFMEPVAEAELPTRFGDFRLIGFQDTLSGAEHVALVMGEVTPEPLLVRVHSECLTGDAFHSLRCDCGPQLDAALQAIAEEGRGAVIYLRQEGRGIGLLNKIRAYALQDGGADTVDANLQLGLPADARDFGIGAQILHLLGARKLRIMTNNPRKLHSLSGFGLEVVERVPLHVGEDPHNAGYLRTKREKLGHLR